MSGNSSIEWTKHTWNPVGYSIDTLLAPLRRKKPTTYFVNSMGDLFHEDVPDEWIDRVGKKRAGRLLDGVEHNSMPVK